MTRETIIALRIESGNTAANRADLVAGKCIVVGSMGEGGVRCSHGTRPHVSEEFCNTVTETEGGYCGGEKSPVAAGAFCKWTFCPAPATTS